MAKRIRPPPPSEPGLPTPAAETEVQAPGPVAALLFQPPARAPSPYFQPYGGSRQPPLPVMPPNWQGTLILNVYPQAEAGEDAVLVGSRNALTKLRDWLSWLLERPEGAIGVSLDGFENSEGVPYTLRVRFGSDSVGEVDWKTAKPEYDPKRAYPVDKT